MGRKIPAKKHRGVKNPLEQQARREKSLKSKINAPPKDPDEQPVPRSLTRLFAFQDRSLTRKKLTDKKTRPSGTHEQKCSPEKNPVSGLKRLAGESGRSFSLRINGAMRALHAHVGVGVGDHYPQDMEAEDVKGERMAEQRARRRRKRRGAPGERAPGAAAPGAPGAAAPGAPGAAAPGAPGAAAPARPGRRALRARAERDKAEQRAQQRAEVRYERVAFGEVAHAPPALRLRPADTDPDTVSRPGGRPGGRALLAAAARLPRPDSSH